MKLPTFRTILIGLGGTGSKVVNKVYGMLDDELKQYVVAHGFDTDVSDLASLEHLTGHLTQISENMTVKTCRSLCGPKVSEWFPVEDGKGVSVLDSKLMTVGAAQMRTISRLAMHYTIGHRPEKFDALEKDIASLFQVDGEELEGPIRIFIIATLAGGTGSGIFLQTASYLQHLLDTKFHQEGVFLRGMFMLPDIFVQTGVTLDNQRNALRANAYACLKELNGMIRQARLGRQGENELKLEFMPGQDSPAVNNTPYNACFLFDFENAKSENLGTGSLGLQRYIDQVTDILYLQLASPVGPKNESLEDNMLRSAIRQNGLNIYGSAGVARIIYPYKDILKYCAGKMVEESLQGEWLYIDSLFEEELRQYNEAVRNGENRQKPVLRTFYVDKLNELGGIGTFHHFFTPLYKETKIDRENRKAQSKTKSFLVAIQEEVKRVVNNNQRFQLLSKRLTDLPAFEKMKDRDSIAGEVRETEELIYEFRNYILQQLIPETPNSILYKIMVTTHPYHYSRAIYVQPKPSE